MCPLPKKKKSKEKRRNLKVRGNLIWNLSMVSKYDYFVFLRIIEDLSEENLLPAESERNDRYVGLVCLHYPHILAQE